MSWIGSIFGMSKPTPAPELSALLTDMHSHLLPGIDDGVRSLDESVELVRQFAQLGYTKLITTPHINERFPNNPQIIRAKCAELNEKLAIENIPVIVEAAAEYLIEDRFETLMREDDLLTFGYRNLLIEFNYYFPYPAILNVIYDLQSAGYNLVLAHPERYSYWHAKPKEFEKLKDREVAFQLNFSSLTGQYSKDVRKMARTFIEREWIDYAGSDVHRQSYFDLFIEGAADKYAERLLTAGRLKNHLL